MVWFFKGAIEHHVGIAMVYILVILRARLAKSSSSWGVESIVSGECLVYSAHKLLFFIRLARRPQIAHAHGWRLLDSTTGSSGRSNRNGDRPDTQRPCQPTVQLCIARTLPHSSCAVAVKGAHVDMFYMFCWLRRLAGPSQQYIVGAERLKGSPSYAYLGTYYVYKCVC